MIPPHYLHILLGFFIGGAIGFAAASIIASYRRHRAYCMGWNAARKLHLSDSDR
jgi:ABC-type nitrate/sulfonate/bicarbonate transport system permease component